MKLTLLRAIGKQRRRITGFVKNKSAELKKIVVLLLVVPLVIPVGATTAAENSSAAPAPTPVGVEIGTLALDEQIAVDSKTFSVTVKDSPYKQRQRERERISAAKVVQATTVAIVDTSPEEKREWAQKAAAAWDIDWRLLEAVWQVESGKRWISGVRSYAGAQGPLQFMPGTWRSYAQDGNGDGVKNVNDARDVLFAAAKLLAVNGASNGNVKQALLRYNHSIAYVNKVQRLAATIQ